MLVKSDPKIKKPPKKTASRVPALYLINRNIELPFVKKESLAAGSIFIEKWLFRSVVASRRRLLQINLEFFWRQRDVLDFTYRMHLAAV